MFWINLVSEALVFYCIIGRCHRGWEGFNLSLGSFNCQEFSIFRGIVVGIGVTYPFLNLIF